MYGKTKPISAKLIIVLSIWADVGVGVLTIGDHLDQEDIVVDKNIDSSWPSDSGDAASDEYDYDYKDKDEDKDEDGGEGEDIDTSSSDLDLDGEPKPNVVSDKRSYLRSN